MTLLPAVCKFHAPNHFTDFAEMSYGASGVKFVELTLFHYVSVYCNPQFTAILNRTLSDLYKTAH